MCVIDALLFDATVLMSRSCGWFYESFCFYREICPSVRLSDFDFERDVGGQLLSLVNDEVWRSERNGFLCTSLTSYNASHVWLISYSFSFIQASQGSSLSFFRVVTSAQGIESFRREFSLLPSFSIPTCHTLFRHKSIVVVFPVTCQSNLSTMSVIILVLGTLLSLSRPCTNAVMSECFPRCISWSHSGRSLECRVQRGHSHSCRLSFALNADPTVMLSYI
jgi:hypothetical protein